MRKIVVHVRDPRDAAVSWFYQIRRREILEDEATVSSLLASDCVPEEISSMDDWEIKQWIVDVYFDKLIGWISSWQSVMEDDARFRILMTNFSKMKHDPSGFFSEIFHFYGFEQAFNRDALPALEKNSFKNNFREGREKEYVDFFTTEQINELNHKMALELRKSFDNE
ncbi:MAG: sulfotransferase domain-containing protein [Opitutales bacterium]|nr:sulfotransferase domain-containing protein [Opitutales bacterium]